MNGSKNRLELESDNAVNSTDILPIHYQKLFQLCSSFHIASLNTQLTACEQLLRQRDIIDDWFWLGQFTNVPGQPPFTDPLAPPPPARFYKASPVP